MKADRMIQWLGVLMVGAGPVMAEIEIVIPPVAQVQRRGVGINVPPPAAAASRVMPGVVTSDTLLFRNGDMLRGSLLSVLPESAVRWSHPDAKQPIEFALTNVVQIKLVGKPAGTTKEGGAIVRLTNGDELRGEIVSLDAEKLTLATWYAGQVQIQRTMLQSIVPQTATRATLLAELTGTDGWVRPQGDNAWTYRNGAFVSATAGSIGRDLKMGDRMRMDFDLSWRNFPYLQVGLYTDNLENLYGNSYMLQISGNTVYLQRGRARNFNNLGGSVNLENFQQRGRAKLTVLVDKPKRSVTLLVDGVMAKQWVDPAEFAGGGTGLMFQSQGQGPMRLANLAVTDWDGELDTGGSKAAAKQEDIIRFVNNDKVSGQLKSIANKLISFGTAFATLDIPAERAVEIEFATEKAERARRQTQDVRAVFHDGGGVTVALEKLDDQSLVGTSENFGKRTFARSAFRELRIHIYDETAQPAKEDEWDF